MATFPVTRQLMIDPISLASMIEEVAGAYLRPYAVGVYIHGHEDPVLIPGKHYYQHEILETKDKKGNVLERKIITTEVQNAADIRGVVYDIDAEVIISARKKNIVSDIPTIPVQGIRIIRAYLDKVITDHSIWSRKTVQSLEEIWGSYVDPEYIHTAEVFFLIERVLNSLYEEVTKFMGDDHWMMHFLKSSGSDLIIETTTDFRIYDWTRRINENEWL